MNKLSWFVAVGCVPMLVGCDQQAAPPRPVSAAKGAGATAPGRSQPRPAAPKAAEPGTTATDPDAGNDGNAVMAIVLLRTRPAMLSADRVKEIVRRECGDEVAKSMQVEEKKGLITGYMFFADPFMLIVHDCVKTYVPPQSVAAAAEEISNAEARAGFLKHTAWVSVDMMLLDSQKAKGSTTPDQLLDRLGSMAAELRDAECVAAYSTAHGEYIPASVASAEKLRAGRIVDLFPRVQQVASEDVDMNAAIAEARKRWPEFVREWESRQSDSLFLVKARFEESGQIEHMWLKVESIDGDRIRGELGNQPRVYSRAKKGELVTVEESQVSDWMYGTPSGAEGAFTDPALRKAIKGKRK